jgi:hypothetical protein
MFYSIINTMLYAIVFVIVGGLAVALLVPLMPGDSYKLGYIAGQFLAPILAVIGAIIGYRRSRRRRR